MKQTRRSALSRLVWMAVASLSTGLAWPQTVLAEGPRVLFDRQSPFTRVLVVEEDGRRCLRFVRPRGDDQSCMDLEQPDRVVFEYVRYLSTILMFVADNPDVLMIGLGGGSAIQMLSPRVPGIRFHVVEIDPRVVEAARLHFGIRASDGLQVTCQDGRKFVEQAKKQWDLVVLDAYGEHNVPFSLTTTEFLHTVKARLRPGGVVAANLWTSNKRLFQAMLRTYREVFPTLYVFPTPTDQNAIVVATDDPTPRSRDEILERARNLAKRTRFPFDFLEAPRRYVPGSDFDLRKAPILTDGKPEIHRELSRPPGLLDL